jgi:hypothetical protein
MAVTKVIVAVGYTQYVLDAKDALQLLDLMNGAEKYEAKWRAGGDTTHHVYAQEDDNTITMKLLPQHMYTMYKLAGKPTD